MYAMLNLFGTPRGLSSSLKSKISQNEIFDFTIGDDYGEAKSLLEPPWGCMGGLSSKMNGTPWSFFIEDD